MYSRFTKIIEDSKIRLLRSKAFFYENAKNISNSTSEFAKSSVSSNIINAVVTGSIGYLYGNMGNEKKLEAAQKNATILSQKLFESENREKKQIGYNDELSHRSDKLVDEMRILDRKLNDSKHTNSSCQHELEKYASAYQTSWLCLYKPKINEIKLDDMQVVNSIRRG